MANTKKLIQAAAGNAGGAGLNVEEVFSTYLYTGNNDGAGAEETQTITNNIDLSGEGGLVWLKKRSDTGGNDQNFVYDTERGATKRLITSSTLAEGTASGGLTQFNSDGFLLGGETNNYNNDEYASWAFRKAENFFDCVTYTGNGTAGRTVSHNLGSVPGCIIIKCTSDATDWNVYHRGNTSAPETDHLRLNTQDATSDDNTIWNDTAPTSTEFTLGTNNEVNGSGRTYVAYLWAHNDGDGEFGPDADQDHIKCGGFTDSNGGTVNLGFEPQWVLIRRSDTDSINPAAGTRASQKNWIIADATRGMSVGTKVYGLAANSNDAEVTPDDFFIKPTATGFEHDSLSYDGTGDFIYIAIRRGPMAVPEDVDNVYDLLGYTGDGASTREFSIGNGVSDMILQFCRSSATYNYPNVSTRITDKGLTTTSNAVEFALATDFDRMDGVHATGFENTLNQSGETYIMHSFTRAPNFFDVVAYDGNSTAGHTVNHNLGVVPEMMWVKSRSKDEDWSVYHEGLGSPPEEYYIYLNNDRVVNSDGNTIKWWNHTAPTSSGFTLGIESRVNQSGHTYIACLFASIDGISKVGSYTGDGNSTQNIDCGFDNTVRFLIIKSTSSGDWRVWNNKVTYISANDDPYLRLNSTAAEITNQDLVEPLASGFVVNSDLNVSGEGYIFYAIAR